MICDGIEYTRILFGSFRDLNAHELTKSSGTKINYSFMVLEPAETRHACLWRYAAAPNDAVSTVLFDEIDDSGNSASEALKTSERRLFQTARRVVTGLLYTMQYTDNFREQSRSRKREIGERRHGPPEHRVTVIGTPIDVNCVQAVKDYISGERRNSPKFQTLTRGHRRRVVVGVGRCGRKVEWIEPYWRGPLEAPILTHPKRVG
jgi:hypothetical protein